jgi:hypothetical protein
VTCHLGMVVLWKAGVIRDMSCDGGFPNGRRAGCCGVPCCSHKRCTVGQNHTGKWDLPAELFSLLRWSSCLGSYTLVAI